MIKAVVFDLDDTLYPEIDYVKSGFAVVARDAKDKLGIENANEILMRLFSENTCGVFDRFVSENKLDSDISARFIELYRNHIPNITLSNETKNALAKLRKKGYKLGIITDGRPQGQRNKILSLGLENMVDKIIITDELGGVEYRKPNPKAFEIMCDALGVSSDEMIYVGDNPRKDFAIKKYLPITTVQIVKAEKGLYNNEAFLYDIESDIKIKAVDEITNAICGEEL